MFELQPLLQDVSLDDINVVAVRREICVCCFAMLAGEPVVVDCVPTGILEYLYRGRYSTIDELQHLVESECHAPICVVADNVAHYFPSVYTICSKDTAHYDTVYDIHTGIVYSAVQSSTTSDK